nr:HAD family phosphatase [Ruegeria atlantica]
MHGKNFHGFHGFVRFTGIGPFRQRRSGRASKRPLPQDDELFRRLVGTNRALGRRLLNEGLAGRVNLAEFDAVWDAETAQRLADCIPVKPGARAMAEHLRERETPYFIATSTQTKKAHLHLERAGFGALFRDVVGNHQVAASKPAPDIYLHATARLGHDPSNCAAFEDSPNGVRAAHAAALITAQVPDIVPRRRTTYTRALHRQQYRRRGPSGWSDGSSGIEG